MKKFFIGVAFAVMMFVGAEAQAQHGGHGGHPGGHTGHPGHAGGGFNHTPAYGGFNHNPYGGGFNRGNYGNSFGVYGRSYGYGLNYGYGPIYGSGFGYGYGSWNRPTVVIVNGVVYLVYADGTTVIY
jgi:hypothetical protein